MHALSDPEAVLSFWFGAPNEISKPVHNKFWFRKSAETDDLIRTRFLSTHEAARRGELDDWLNQPRSCLAYVITTDQFPRNLFRDTPDAFSTDAMALAAARHALAQSWDQTLLPIERVFLYLPFEHSEDRENQARSVALFDALRGFEGMEGYYDYALAHQRIIERFGRFPHRNAILRRSSTPEETAFLQQPGSRF